jgi:hypothetical protein
MLLIQSCDWRKGSTIAITGMSYYLSVVWLCINVEFRLNDFQIKLYSLLHLSSTLKTYYESHNDLHNCLIPLNHLTFLNLIHDEV